MNTSEGKPFGLPSGPPKRMYGCYFSFHTSAFQKIVLGDAILSRYLS
jgi:hypothetical protein